MEFDFGKKKSKNMKEREKEKKAKKEEEVKEKDAPTREEGENVMVEWERGPVYDYDMLLGALCEMIEERNPTLGAASHCTLKPPRVVREGSKKVSWVNFVEICQMMHRDKHHVKQFVFAELATQGSIRGGGQLILRGKFQERHCEGLLRKYVKEFVTCAMCKSATTELQRDSSTKLYVMSCQCCGATRATTSIRCGYHAVTGADRFATRQAGPAAARAVAAAPVKGTITARGVDVPAPVDCGSSKEGPVRAQSKRSGCLIATAADQLDQCTRDLERDHADEPSQMSEDGLVEDDPTNHLVLRAPAELPASGMRIHVATMGGRTATLEVEAEDAIATVKGKVQDLWGGIQPEQQRLIFEGQLLEDGRTLSECGIVEESTVSVVVDTPFCIHFLVTRGPGDQFIESVDVQSSATIRTLKGKFWWKLGFGNIPMGVLMWRGEPLEDDRTLGSYSMRNNDVLHFDLTSGTDNPAHPRCLVVVAQRHHQAKPFVLNIGLDAMDRIRPSDRIKKVKAKIQEQVRAGHGGAAAPASLRLFFAGQQLEDDHTLLHYNFDISSDIMFAEELEDPALKMTQFMAWGISVSDEEQEQQMEEKMQRNEREKEEESRWTALGPNIAKKRAEELGPPLFPKRGRRPLPGPAAAAAASTASDGRGLSDRWPLPGRAAAAAAEAPVAVVEDAPSGEAAAAQASWFLQGR